MIQSRHFRELQIDALELSQAVCLEHERGFREESGPPITDSLLSFAIEARATVQTAFAGLPINDLDTPFDHFVEQLANGASAPGGLPEFTVESGDYDDEWLLFHFDDPARSGNISVKGDNAACRAVFRAACDAVLDDLALAINYYKFSYESMAASETLVRLNRIADQWDRFLDFGRSQTLLDLSLTSIIERKHFKRGALVEPPPRQWSLLHPGLAYEHAGASLSGQNDRLGVVIEWVGVNWWGDRSPLGIPFGVSLASTYADRTAVAAAGHGLLFHFDNRYSIGWTRRSGDDAYFLSVDLLRLMDNNRERLLRYRRKLEEDYR